jgi:hypothetical protein
MLGFKRNFLGMSLNLFWQFQIDGSLTKQNWKCYRVSWNAFFTEIFTHGTVWGLKSFFLCYISLLMTCATFRYLVVLLLSVSIRDQLVLLWYRFQSSAFVQNKLKRWRLMSVTRQYSTECASTHKTNACIWTSTYPTTRCRSAWWNERLKPPVPHTWHIRYIR